MEPLAQVPNIAVFTEAPGRRHRRAQGRTLFLAVTALLLPWTPGPSLAHAVGNQKDKPQRGGAWKAALPNGVTVELLGVAEKPLERNRWWKPDGTDLKPPFTPDQETALKQYLEITDKLVAENSKAAPLFALKLTYPGEGPVGILYKFAESTNAGLNAPLSSLRRAGQTTEMRALRAAFREPVQRCTLRYGVAAGSWQTVATVDGALASLSGPEQEKVAFERKGEAASPGVLVSDRLGEVERRLTAVDPEGKLVSLPQGITANEKGLAQTFYLLPPNADRFKEYRLETRPFHWAEFRDIRLQVSDL